jgi:propionyl-CoA carboxylase alpha chain
VVGQAGIEYLDGRPDLRAARLPDDARRRQAVAAGFALLSSRAARSRVPVPVAGWRNVGVPLHTDVFTDAAGEVAVRVSRPDQAGGVLLDGVWSEVGTAIVSDDAVDLTSAGLRRRYRVRLTPHGAFVNGPEGQSSFALHSEDDLADRPEAAGECRAPLPGAITKVLVSTGDTVSEGDGLVVLEAMKMEHTLRSGGSGTVVHVLCEPGQQVDVGDVLVVVEPA